MSERDDLDLVERVAASLRTPEPVDATFERRLLQATRSAIARGEAPWQRPNVVTPPAVRRSWLISPRPIMVSPLVGLAAAAVFAAVVVGSTLTIARAHGSAARREIAVATAAKQEVVRFVIVAPSAKQVALVGDFNGWNPVATRLARDGAGTVWTVTLPLEAGTYQYAFVVDGRAWLADPSSPLALEDDFGAPSSVLTVGRRT